MMHERPPGGLRTSEEIVALLRSRGPALVALSGGVDSASVAALARAALGEEAVAATVVSRSVAADEVDSARRVAESIGIRHRWVEAEPLEDAEYRANRADRCYRCRVVETAALRRVGEEAGARQFLDGVHRDDLRDDRPGIRAMDEQGFFHPFLWANWSKADVRRYARSMGLPNWDRPSNACLASRVARGDPISAALLGRVDRAESLVRSLGFRRVRVRVRGTGATVQVGADETARLRTAPVRRALARELASLGFEPVEFDPVGHLGEPLPVVG